MTGGHLLAVHAVSHATVAGDAVPEVLDVESTLETGREEATEGRDQGSEAGEHEDVQLVRSVGDRVEGMSDLWHAT